jgi:DNA-directed RNA polymerase specialized sigma24 family protein
MPDRERRFRAVWEAHAADVYRYVARRLPPDGVDAADVVSDLFLVAWRRDADRPDDADALPWLYGVLDHSWIAVLGQRSGDRVENVIAIEVMDADTVPPAEEGSDIATTAGGRTYQLTSHGGGWETRTMTLGEWYLIMTSERADATSVEAVIDSLAVDGAGALSVDGSPAGYALLASNAPTDLTQAAWVEMWTATMGLSVRTTLGTTLADQLIHATGPLQAVDVDGHPGWLSHPMSDGGSDAVLVWEAAPDTFVSVHARGLPDEEVLAVARAVELVDSVAWEQAYGPVAPSGTGS